MNEQLDSMTKALVLAELQVGYSYEIAKVFKRPKAVYICRFYLNDEIQAVGHSETLHHAVLLASQELSEIQKDHN